MAHHFENGVWIYRAPVIADMESDFDETLKKCIPVSAEMAKTNILGRIIRSVARIFAPLL